jgi:hypothetical protein
VIDGFLIYYSKLHQIVQIASYLILIVTKGGLMWVMEERCLNLDNIANVHEN